MNEAFCRVCNDYKRTVCYGCGLCADCHPAAGCSGGTA
jgi:hypothetical protein